MNCYEKYSEYLSDIIDENTESKKLLKQFLKDPNESDLDFDIRQLKSLVDCEKLKNFDKNVEQSGKDNFGLHNLEDKCYSINNKKSKFYIHTYDPTNMSAMIDTLSFDLIDKLKI